jgi:hypothetical protein
MKKIIALVILTIILVTASGCEVTHKTEVNSTHVITSIEDISELGVK